ncbi:MAG: tyrosine--tRNA ligase [Candidatus Altiarchaeales archaeon]|nr:MAG: tyrosine--tRNA ligase [Candidatus Altiarchaeales archaeon]
MNEKILELIKRNTAEIVTETELAAMLREKNIGEIVTYCGYEVSGPVHLGTLVTANKQLDFLKAGLKVKVLFADVHTLLNRKGDEKFVEEMLDYWKTVFKAFGLEKAEFILGSEFQFDDEYIKDVLKLSLNVTIKRALRSMQEIARDIEHARVSQIVYPMMQIADIKHLGVDIAHGGLEQRKIHMLARETLEDIEYKKPICIHTPLLVSILGSESKMSSSKPETTIKVEDSEEVVREKIKKAYCPISNENNPILQISRYLIFPRFGEFIVKRDEKFGGDLCFENYESLEKAFLSRELHPLDLKENVARYVNKLLEPIREKLG